MNVRLVNMAAVIALAGLLLFPAAHAQTETVERYSVVLPQVVEKDPGEEFFPKSLTVVLATEECNFTLKLQLNGVLIPRTFKSHYFDKNGKEVIDKGRTNCFYQGEVSERPDWQVVVNLCKGLSGTFGVHGAEVNREEFYHIEPLRGDSNTFQRGKNLIDLLTRPHAIYLDTELSDSNGTCGSHPGVHDHHPTIDLSAEERSKLRAKRQSGQQFLFVELVIVNDQSQFNENGNLENTVIRALDIANQMDTLFRVLNVRIALVDVITWNAGNQISVVSNPETLLNNFRTYKPQITTQHDAAMLLTNVDLDGSTIGIAFLRATCGSSAVGVTQDTRRSVAAVGATASHELGHNMNMDHDDASSCNCSDGTSRCIMAATITFNPPTRWSQCSIDQLNSGFTGSRNLDRCLFNEPTMVVGDPVCGNGIQEDGEACDCGSPQECTNQCCNANTCQLASNAECSSGTCCDIATCRLRPYGTQCRSSSSSCDIAEYCSGGTQDCPQDLHRRNTTTCNSGNDYCYDGTCQTHSDQCQFHFATTPADSSCYSVLNTDGTEGGNCGYTQTAYIACTPRGFSPLPGTDIMNPGLVADGTRCGNGLACYSQQCISVGNLPTLTGIPACPTRNGQTCSGNGSVYEVKESSGSVEICVDADGILEDYLTVYLFTIPGTATAADFYPLSESLTFRDGGRHCVNISIVTGDALENLRVLKFKFQRRRRFIGSITEEQCFNVTILSDPFVEEDEVFLVQLSTDDSGVVLSTEEAEVVIVDNDYVIAQMELAEYNVCEGVGSLMVCAAVTGGTVTSSFTFTLATNPGTATAPEDYEDVSVEVVGEQIPCLSITIEDDMERESSDETFTVVLSTSDPSVIIVSPNTSTVTIYDNEEPRIEFINNTPDSTGFNISSEFQIEGCINQTMCTIRQTGESIACENSVSFTQERNGARTLFITASGFCGNSQTLSRILRSDVSVCDVHQINGGVEQATVDGNSATVLFEGTGPSVDNVVTDFGLSIRRESAGEFENIVTGLMCSTAATQAPSPFTVTCSLELAEYNVCEGVGSLMVCAAATGGSVISSFTLATNPGAATAPEDYEDVSVEVVGEQIPCLSITIEDDMERESCDETLTVVLSTSDPSVIIVSPNTSTVTIYDNEEPRIEFINNTPDSTRFNISSEFLIEGCINQTMCTVRQTGESIACENSVSFTQERNSAHTLFITASGFCGNSQTLSRILRSDVSVCDVHQINGGVEQATVDGNSATVLFEGT
ncbi:Disintegrin and metalloproteinase domain-containing protein 8, partial [Geodia barretti]